MERDSKRIQLFWPRRRGHRIAFCLIEDDIHPYRINDYDDPVSSAARQLNREITEAPRAGGKNEVNVASSMVTVPVIKSGACSGKMGALTRFVWAKSTSVA